MDCNGYQELITGAVDEELSGEEQRFLSLHLEACAACRAEFAAETSLKNFVHETLAGHTAPADLVRAVAKTVGAEPEAAGSSLIERWKEVLAVPFVRPGLALGVTVVLAIIFLTGQPDGDLIRQSLDRFQLVQKGSVAVQFASSEPAVLRSFFTSKTDFPVMVPEMKDCTLLGGVLEEHPGGAVAEVFYNHGTKQIFLSQISWSSLDAGGSFSLDEDVRETLERDNLFITSEQGRTVILWKKGSTLCTAVSTLGANDLIYCLTSGDPDLLKL